MKSRLVTGSLIWVFVPYIFLSAINSPGNPGGDPYAGQPGSVYDAKANPPRANGVVTYNPDASVTTTVQQETSNGVSTVAPTNAMPSYPNSGTPQNQ
jgi:hypothetical protein